MATRIYRMTHIENLPRLLEWGGDWSQKQATTRGLSKRPIHHTNIMDARERTVIDVPPGGVAADYVPFYFGPRSPMLYAIKNGKVDGCKDQTEIIYLVSTAEAVAGEDLPFVFTDGHAIISYVNHFNRLDDLPKLPWDAIRAQYWNNLVDGRCKRQSEFLVRDFFPIALVDEIGVANPKRLARVQEILAQTGASMKAKVCNGWYF
jgi:hypothetical protein